MDEEQKKLFKKNPISWIISAFLIFGTIYYFFGTVATVVLLILFFIINPIIKSKEKQKPKPSFIQYCNSNIENFNEKALINKPNNAFLINAFVIDRDKNTSCYLYNEKNVFDLKKFHHKQIENFIPETIFWHDTVLALDYINKNIYLIDKNDEGNLIAFKDVLSIKTIEFDGRSTTVITDTSAKTDTGNMLTRAVVGGVLTGGVGAIIGGVTARKTSNSVSKTITTGSITYRFMIICNGVESRDYIVNLNKKEDAISLENVFEKILNENSVEKNNQLEIKSQRVNAVNSLNEKSFADELIKLSQLKTNGYITDDEFKQLKERLMDNS